MDIKLDTGAWPLLATVVALVALGAAPGPAQGAENAPHAHAHAPAASAEVNLDHGRRWATDAPLRSGMARIRALSVAGLGRAQAGQLSQAQYRDLAGKIEIEVGGIVAKCKLPPEADAVLHGVIAEIMGGADAMAGKDPTPPELLAAPISSSCTR